MTSTDNDSSATLTPVVEDPHPGSISDGTSPEAMKRKPPLTDKRSDAENHASRTAAKPALESGHPDVNSEAPKHPNKSAY